MRRVLPVVVEARLRVETLAGIAERRGRRRALAVGLVRERRERRGRRAHGGDDRAQQVRHQGRTRAGRDVHLVQEIVGSQPVGVPAKDRAGRAIVFQHLAVVGIADRDRGRTAGRLQLAPAEAVEGVGADGGHAVCRRDQLVLGVVGICEVAVVRQVAVAVVGRAGRADGGVLVEVVGGVAGGRRCRGGIADPAVVADRLAGALVHGVVSVGEGHVRPGGGRHGRGRGGPRRAGGAVERIVCHRSGVLDTGGHRDRRDRGARVADAGASAGQIVGIGHDRSGGRGRARRGGSRQRLGTEAVQGVVGVSDRQAGARAAQRDIAVGVVAQVLGARETQYNPGLLKFLSNNHRMHKRRSR